jgi:hypothetical protein
MAWPWEVVERDHEIQDPVSPEKIRLLGDYLRLTSQSASSTSPAAKAAPP